MGRYCYSWRLAYNDGGHGEHISGVHHSAGKVPAFCFEKRFDMGRNSELLSTEQKRSIDIMSPKVYTIRDKNFMKNSEMNLIRNKIMKMPAGSVFVVSDFTDIAGYENSKKCFLRLEKEGLVRRVIRGVYDKPFFSGVLNEYAAPNIVGVANAIARNYNWKTSPAGLTALNLLGLSTQVTNTYEFYSSGQYKTYEIGKITIRFKHKSSKELLDLSFKSSLVVNAIKELGPSIDEHSIESIRKRLSADEKRILLHETSGVTKWIYEITKKICSQEV